MKQDAGAHNLLLWSTMRKFVVSLIVLAAFLLTVTALAEDPKGEEKPQNKKPVAVKKAAPAKINWMKYDTGIKKAKEEGKKIFVEFTAKWCGWCKKMHATTFVDPEVVELMNTYFIAVSVDGDSPDTLKIDGWMTSERNLAREYRVTSYPTYWFLTPEIEAIAPVKGYRDRNAMVDILDYLKDDLYKTVTFKDFLEKKYEKQSGR